MTSILRNTVRGAAAFAFLIAVIFSAARPAFAQAETLLYSFCNQGSSCPDGSIPGAVTLISDGKGNFYGTTTYGGTYNFGTVFQVSSTGAETVLYSFGANSTDGILPYGSLLLDHSGNLYGTTVNGGAHANGTAFKLSPEGMETILHSFNANGIDGSAPEAGLIMDASSNLYGTTVSGGAYNDQGVLFKLSPDGTETILHSFGNGMDVGGPLCTLLMDQEGSLYGTAQEAGGPYNGGGVFKVSSDGTETVLHAFGGSGDGVWPAAGVIMDKHGNLYGTTEFGGKNSNGTLFKLSSDGTETILHHFGYKTDGSNPQSSLIMDEQGNVYGTTFSGGKAYQFGGTVYEYRSDGTEIILHSFGNSDTDGRAPRAALVVGSDSHLFGTTSNGGKNGDGSVFQITP